MKGLTIIDCEQGSKDWFNVRCGKFTGSDMSDLIYEPGVYKTGDKKGTDKPIPKEFLNIVAKKRSESKHAVSQHEIDTRVGRCVYPNYKPSIGLNGEYGKIMEPDALEYYAKKYNEQVYTVGFVISNKYPDNLGVSPDALHVIKRSGVEIKCPVTLSIHDTHCALQTPLDLKKFNERYYWQVLANMYVCEADSWDFVSYMPFLEPQHVMSCLVINRSDIQEDLNILEHCIVKAIELKTCHLPYAINILKIVA